MGQETEFITENVHIASKPNKNMYNAIARVKLYLHIYSYILVEVEYHWRFRYCIVQATSIAFQ